MLLSWQGLQLQLVYLGINTGLSPEDIIKLWEIQPASTANGKVRFNGLDGGAALSEAASSP